MEVARIDVRCYYPRKQPTCILRLQFATSKVRFLPLRTQSGATHRRYVAPFSAHPHHLRYRRPRLLPARPL
jgi:hypothetical protein